MSEPTDTRRGVTYMVAAAFFFSLMSVLVKLGGRSMPSMQLVLGRVVVTFVLGYITIRRAGLHPLGVNRRVLFLRGAFGTTALCCFYYALTVLPLGDATAIQYTSPTLTALFGALVLGESIRRSDVLGTICAVTGVLLIARPTFLFGGEPLPTLGLLAAAVGAVLSAGAYLSVRVLRKTDDPLVVVFWFPLVAAPVVVPWALSLWVPPTPAEWLLLLGLGTTTHIAQIFLTRGIHLLPAGRATSVGYIQLVFAFCFGALLFSEWPTAWNVGGACLIVGGTLVASGALRIRRPGSRSPRNA